MRLLVSDLVSPSYFTATAAVELGFFKAEGVDAEIVPGIRLPGHSLRGGGVDFAVRAVVKAQKALRADPFLATQVGRRLFPPAEAEIIAELIERDAPFYDPSISEEAVVRLNQFAQDVGLLTGPIPYERVVATQFVHLWKE